MEARCLALAVLLAIPSLPALAECYPLGVTAILDGDTVVGNGQRIRLEGIDTAEMRASCENEAILANLARDHLTQQILMADRVHFCPSGQDRYGRTLATVKVDGKDAGQALVAAGLARVWTGRREGWCD